MLSVKGTPWQHNAPVVRERGDQRTCQSFRLDSARETGRDRGSTERVYFGASWRIKHHQSPTKRHPERETRVQFVAGEGKTRGICWRSGWVEKVRVGPGSGVVQGSGRWRRHTTKIAHTHQCEPHPTNLEHTRTHKNVEHTPALENWSTLHCVEHTKGEQNFPKQTTLKLAIVEQRNWLNSNTFFATLGPRHLQRHQHNVKTRFAGDMRRSGYRVDAVLWEVRGHAVAGQLEVDLLACPVSQCVSRGEEQCQTPGYAEPCHSAPNAAFWRSIDRARKFRILEAVRQRGQHIRSRPPSTCTTDAHDNRAYRWLSRGFYLGADKQRHTPSNAWQYMHGGDCPVWELRVLSSGTLWSARVLHACTSCRDGHKPISVTILDKKRCV